MGCTSRARNLKFRARNVDLHRSDPQRSGTPDIVTGDDLILAMALKRHLQFERIPKGI